MIKKLVEYLKNYNIVDPLILFFGLITYYFNTIFLWFIYRTFFCTTGKILDNFKKDQITIKKHYLEDFKFFYLFVFSFRIIYLCILLFFHQMLTILTILVIFFKKNNPRIELCINILSLCY